MEALGLLNSFFLIAQFLLEGLRLLFVLLDQFFDLLLVKIFDLHQAVFLLLGLQQLLL